MKHVIDNSGFFDCFVFDDGIVPIQKGHPPRLFEPSQFVSVVLLYFCVKYMDPVVVNESLKIRVSLGDLFKHRIYLFEVVVVVEGEQARQEGENRGVRITNAPMLNFVIYCLFPELRLF